MGELGVVAFPYGGADWTALLCEVFPALVFGEPIHRVSPLVEAPAFAALVHEVVRQAFLLPFADGTGGFRAGYTADGLLGRGEGPAPGHCFAGSADVQFWRSGVALCSRTLHNAAYLQGDSERSRRSLAADRPAAAGPPASPEEAPGLLLRAVVPR